MFSKVRYLLALTRLSRWVIVVVLSLIVSGLEAIGAALVLFLLRMISDPENGMTLPVIGDLRSLGSEMSDRTLTLVILGSIGLFFLIRALAKILQTYVQQRVIQQAGLRLSTKLVEGYLRMPYVWQLKRNSAELIRNAHQAVNRLVTQVFQPSVSLVSQSMLLLMLLAVLILASPLATALAIAIIGPTVYLLTKSVQPSMKRLGRVAHVTVRNYFAVLQESLTGIRDVKLLGRIRYFARRFSSERAAYAKANYLQRTMAQIPSVLMEFSLLLFILVFFAMTVTRGGSVTDALPVLGLFAYAGLRLQPSLQTIIQAVTNLKFASAPVDDLYADLTELESSGTTKHSKSPDPLPFEQEIRIDSVSFTYDGSPEAALTGVNLSIARGESVGICGPTGGGKSTFVDLLVGLLQPTSGEIRIDGVQLTDSTEAWQANLGVVSQIVFLLDDTLRRNVAFGMPDDGINDARVREVIALAQLADFVDSLPDGLETRIGERGTRLSGGQRQRVAIARALYRDPAVLIFDEGTSALDSITEAELIGTLERLSSDRTVITIAHRLTTIKNADRIVVIEGGKITGMGTFAELARKHPFLLEANP